MKKTHDIVIITGKYTDVDGKEKNRYEKLGVVFNDEKGSKIKIDLTPIAWDGWAYLYASDKL